ncbi:hypothetical protein BH24ACT15_BH24ACT15_31430 [soil metagenome]
MRCRNAWERRSGPNGGTIIGGVPLSRVRPLGDQRTTEAAARQVGGGAAEITAEVVYAKWAEMAPLIDTLQRRIADPSDFTVPPGSDLAEDDRASSPYQLSHAVKQCLNVAVDHLHTVKTVVVDVGYLHTFSPFSLARGALESAAAGYWMLTPDNCQDRVLRALRVQSQNARDQHKVVELNQPRSLDEHLARIAGPAVRMGLDPATAGEHFSVTEVVTEVGERTNMSIRFEWQMCSGFAHGRQWATFGALDRETFATDEPGVHLGRLANNDSAALLPNLDALHLIGKLLRLWRWRAGLESADPRGLADE